MKRLNQLLILAFFIFISGIVMGLYSCGNVFNDSDGVNGSDVTTPHKCNWKGCDYQGLTSMPVPCYTMDSIHLVHPNWDYERCTVIEDSLFNNHKKINHE